MKPLIPALLLSAAIPALCQTTQRQFKIPPQPSPRILPQPRIFPFDKQVPAPGLAIRTPLAQVPGPQIDWQIIRRPPQDAFSQWQPRTSLAKNLYPDLKLMRIETARLGPIPVYFPKFKLEPIPLTAPDANMIPIQTNALKTEQAK
jgi:hypothetical protein